MDQRLLLHSGSLTKKKKKKKKEKKKKISIYNKFSLNLRKAASKHDSSFGQVSKFVWIWISFKNIFLFEDLSHPCGKAYQCVQSNIL